MTINANVHIEAGGTISARIGGLGSVVIEVRPEAHNKYTGVVTIHVYEKTNPKEHAQLCKAFGLQNETAPGVDSEDGVPARNEPARASAFVGTDKLGS